MPSSPAPHIRPGDQFRLASVRTVLPGGVHPRAGELENRISQWLDAQSLFADAAGLQRFRSQRNALWTAAVYPAVSFERALDVARLITLLFILDDLVIDEPDRAIGVLADCSAVLEGHQASTGPGVALAGIWASWTSRATPGLQQQMAAAAARYAGAELAARDAAAMTLSQYAAMRLAQTEAIWVLTQYAAGVELDTTARAQLGALHDAAARHILWSNDLYSFRSEHFRGDHANAICLLTRAGACLQGAVDQITALVTASDTEVAQEAERLHAAPGSRDTIRRYAATLAAAVGGNLRQAQFAPRYHGAGASPGQVISDGTVTLWPDRTGYEPAVPLVDHSR